MWQARRASLAIVSLWLLVGLAGGLAGEFVHTDDGCAFETHCLVCQRAAGSVAVFATPLTPLPCLEPVGATDSVPTVAPSPAPLRGEAPRGPPPV